MKKAQEEGLTLTDEEKKHRQKTTADNILAQITDEETVKNLLVFTKESLTNIQQKISNR